MSTADRHPLASWKAWQGCVIFNMVNSDKEMAEKVFATQVMDVLQALIMKANLDTGNAHPNPTLIKIKELCDKSLAVAHQYSIVRTQLETAVAEEEEEFRIEPWQPAPGAWALE